MELAKSRSKKVALRACDPRKDQRRAMAAELREVRGRVTGGELRHLIVLSVATDGQFAATSIGDLNLYETVGLMDTAKHYVLAQRRERG